MRLRKLRTIAAALALAAALVPAQVPVTVMAADAEAQNQEQVQEEADKDKKEEEKKEDKDKKDDSKDEKKEDEKSEVDKDKEDVQAAQEAAEDPAQGSTEAAAQPQAAPQKEGDAKGTLADALKEEQSTLSDDCVYLVRIGYQFDDGSFDEWARGTALLAGPATNAKVLVTRQGLADTAASSALAARIKSEREEVYSRIGVYLSNDTETEAHMRVRVIDTKGNEEDIAGIKIKNGLALITLRTAPSTPACVFGAKTSPAEIRGREIGIKAAGSLDDRSEVRTFTGEVIEPSDKSDGLYVSADMSGISATGGILFDSKGHVVGMIAGEGDEKPCFTVNAIQTFMSTNGVTYRTASEIEERSSTIEKEDVADAIREAEASVPETDKTGLQESYDLAKKLRKGKYTKESYAAVEANLEPAEKCLANEKATPAEVKAAKENLDAAVAALEEKSIPISAQEAIPVIAGLVILAIVIAVAKSVKEKGGRSGAARRRKAKSTSRRNRKEEASEEDDLYDDLDIDVTKKSKKRKEGYKPSDSHASRVTYAEDIDLEESRVVELDKDGSDGTSLLTTQAYLVRKDNGNKIPITSGNFVIGKEAGKVDYQIKGNTTVSRQHARIIVKEDKEAGKNKYYIEDLHSRNFTYVNGEQIRTEDPAVITDGTMIRLSNVEMEFHEK